MHSIFVCSMICKNTCVRLPSESEERVFKYREFDLEGDLVGEPHTWFLSGLSSVTRLKLD